MKIKIVKEVNVLSAEHLPTEEDSQQEVQMIWRCKKNKAAELKSWDNINDSCKCEIGG
jgi:hypothetical protein